MDNKNKVEKYKITKELASFYDHIKTEWIGEVSSWSYELKHKKSLAKILLLHNNDIEKSFTIGFKTPPKDSTGVFHIIEHSVLCGSKKFPLKEPFVNLIKSSMATFLNAMTFDDKTIYPVATTNEKDLYNLMQVYLDAVFFPNIYKNKNIFYQEGGHKTIDESNKLNFCGVVYNEMCGNYSSTENVLYEHVMRQLFPNTCYANVSGGRPDAIKNLSYQEFLEEHNAHYNLSNAYIVLYGNFNINNMLKFLDTEYLSKKEEIDKWRQNSNSGVKLNSYSARSINTQSLHTASHKKVKMKTSPDNTDAVLGYVIERDHTKIIATNILLDVIAGSEASPLKNKLLKTGLFADINFELEDSICQPVVFVNCKKTKAGVAETLNKKISSICTDLLKDGLDHTLIEAAIKRFEFLLKENSPEYSHGIDATISLMSTWLYDDSQSTLGLKYNDVITFLKKNIKFGYFEKLLCSLFIENNFFASVEIVPTKDTQENAVYATESEKLAVESICRDLDLWQQTQDTKEAENSLPVLTLNDIEQNKPLPSYKKQDNFLIHDTKIDGITYTNFYIKVNSIDFEDVTYLSLLASLFSKLDTQKHNALELDTIITNHLGSLNFSLHVSNVYKKNNKPDLYFVIKTSCLDNELNNLTDILEEILFATKFENKELIRSLIKQQITYIEQKFVESGHISSFNRAMSYFSPSAVLNEKAYGIDYYKFIKDLDLNFETNFNDLSSKFFNLKQKLLHANLLVSYSGENENLKIIKSWVNYNFKQNENSSSLNIPRPKNLNEAFIIPSNVGYASCVVDLDILDYLKGAMKIVCSAITYDYLWNEVRVKNGAYGSQAMHTKFGSLIFYSYRDPNFKNTYSVYDNVSNWLANVDITKEQLDLYIISTIGKLDKPKTVRETISLLDHNYLSKYPNTLINVIRTQALNAKLSDIKTIANALNKINNNQYRCMFNSEETCKYSEMNIKNIFSL